MARSPWSVARSLRADGARLGQRALPKHYGRDPHFSSSKISAIGPWFFGAGLERPLNQGHSHHYMLVIC